MYATFRFTARPVALALGALLSTIVLWLASTLALAVALAATALIVPGTGTPNANIVGNYLENARDYYVAPFNPACTAQTDCDLIGINYPAQFWPMPFPGWGGLSGAKWDVSTGKGITNLNGTLFNTLTGPAPDVPVIIFGYSQGGNVVSREKRLLRDLGPELKNELSFVMIGNTNRPNGGLFERLAALGHVPILDATFGLPAPTDIGIGTTDIAFEYDGVVDFPLYPLNLLATLNAIAGFAYVHGTYLAPNANSDVGELPDDYTPEELAEQLDQTSHPENFRSYGDTTYITIPTRTLPIMRPFLDLAAVTGTTALIKPIVDLISPALRVLIDTGYNRHLNPGVPAPLRLIPLINPFTLITDLIEAVGEGIHAAVTDIFGTGTGAGAASNRRTSAPPTRETTSSPDPRSTTAQAESDSITTGSTNVIPIRTKRSFAPGNMLGDGTPAENPPAARSEPVPESGSQPNADTAETLSGDTGTTTDDTISPARGRSSLSLIDGDADPGNAETADQPDPGNAETAEPVGPDTGQARGSAIQGNHPSAGDTQDTDGPTDSGAAGASPDATAGPGTAAEAA